MPQPNFDIDDEVEERVPDRRTELVRGASELVLTATALSNPVTRDDADKTAAFLRGVRTRTRAIKAHYKKMRESVRRTLADYKSYEDQDLAPWLAADTLVSVPLEQWLAADRASAEAHNRATLVEAEAKAVAERDAQAQALRDQAQAAGNTREQKALQAQARTVERSKPMPVLTGALVEPAKLAGIAVPVRKVAEVVDAMLLIRGVVAGTVPMAAIQIDQSWLDEQATQRGRDLNFPGVIVRDKISLTARGL